MLGWQAAHEKKLQHLRENHPDVRKVALEEHRKHVQSAREDQVDKAREFAAAEQERESAMAALEERTAAKRCADTVVPPVPPVPIYHLCCCAVANTCLGLRRFCCLPSETELRARKTERARQTMAVANERQQQIRQLAAREDEVPVPA